MIAAEVAKRLKRNRAIGDALITACFPCSDRQLAAAIGAHAITMRRAIDHGTVDDAAAGGARVLHKSRSQVLDSIEQALPCLDSPAGFEALERRVLRVLAQIKHGAL
jgi:hypothetical protein